MPRNVQDKRRKTESMVHIRMRWGVVMCQLQTHYSRQKR